MPKMLFDDDYTGPRYTYGLTYRPLARFAVPDGWVIDSSRPHSDYPTFGVVDYPRPLTEQELYRYDMILIKEAPNA